MISEVRDKARKFLKETIGAEGEVRIVTVEKDGDGWIAEAEVAEKNQYLATVNPNYRVFDKRFYTIKLDNKLEVSSYKQGEGNDEEKEA